MNHENFFPAFEETPNRAEQLKKLEKLELEKVKKLGLFQTDEQISADIEKLIKKGIIALQSDIQPNLHSIPATDYKDNPLKTPHTHKEWLEYSNLCLKLVEKLQRNEIKPY